MAAVRFDTMSGVSLKAYRAGVISRGRPIPWLALHRLPFLP
jgi:hypothetical protein